MGLEGTLTISTIDFSCSASLHAYRMEDFADGCFKKVREDSQINVLKHNVKWTKIMGVGCFAFGSQGFPHWGDPPSRLCPPPSSPFPTPQKFPENSRETTTYCSQT